MSKMNLRVTLRRTSIGAKNDPVDTEMKQPLNKIVSSSFLSRVFL